MWGATPPTETFMLFSYLLVGPFWHRMRGGISSSVRSVNDLFQCFVRLRKGLILWSSYAVTTNKIRSDDDYFQWFLICPKTDSAKTTLRQNVMCQNCRAKTVALKRTKCPALTTSLDALHHPWERAIYVFEGYDLCPIFAKFSTSDY